MPYIRQMKVLMLTCLLFGMVTHSLSQNGKMEDSLLVRYSPQQTNYYFYWNGNKDRTFYWDTIYGGEKCTLFIINNSSDTLLIERLRDSSNQPIYWELSPSKKIYNPGDTLVIKSRTSRRHGPFNRLLQILFHSSSNLNSQTWYLKYNGFYSDRLELKRIEEAKRLKELEDLKNANPNFAYYPNGQIKSKKNPKPENDSLPIYIEYYENGVVKLEEFNRIGVRKKAYDQQGRIKNEWDDKDLRTEYYSNGKVKLKETKGPFTNSSTDLTHYFENGCLKKEEFGNQTVIKEYDSLVCGKLTDVNTKYPYGKIRTHHKEGEIIGQTILPNVGGRIEVKGEFSNGILRNGVVTYYSQTGVLLFENKITNANRDNILVESEEQGQQINLFDVNGKKTGLWITDEVTKHPITLTQDYYSTTYLDAKSFDFYQFEYIGGDTAARIIFHEYGGVSNYLYIKDKEKRINSNQEFANAYYTNGYIAFKSYQLKNGMLVGIEYSEEKENLIISGKKGNCGEMIFKDNKLIEIHSVKQAPEVLDDPYTGNLSPILVSLEDSIVEKGQFKNFELYNGFIYYYKKGGTLIRTEKVVNGIIQGNPRVNFTEPKLPSAALVNDLNFNGWPESREVDSIETINLWIEPKEMDEFKWTELSKFKSLLVLYANGRVYRLDDYANYDSLKLAIQQNKGNEIRRQRYSWESGDSEIKKDVFVHIVDSVKTEVEIVNFPDVEAAFPGGYDKLKLWLKNNLVYPAKVNIEGRVFVSFIVLKDGSITGVKIEKGLHPDLDKEAMRLVKAMPKWKPAIWNGLDVASQVRLPIMFKL